ncbi:hypothetical protein AB0M45_29615 [Nocardia sp. NPDC051787]|uniref:hypothetical protein n=1 Tax=Nocardia sp. NPDC051787 TaxID=3155415 RepID=UPI00343EDC2B
MGDSVIVRVANAATKTWWRNFRSPHQVSIRMDCVWVRGSGRVVAPGSLEHEEVQAVYQKAHPRQRIDVDDPYVVIAVGAEQTTLSRRNLRRRWFAAVTAGETLGFAAPAAAGALTAASAPAVIAAALLIAAAIEGGVLALFQSRVLRWWLPGFPARDWIMATAAGALVAWTVGLVPVLYGDRFGDLPVAVQIPAVATGAIVMLFAIGVAQWSVLRHWSDHAVLWIWGNAVGWIAGLAAFAAVTSPLWQAGQSTTVTAMIGALGGLVMAAVVAAATGLFLVRILAPRHLCASA